MSQYIYNISQKFDSGVYDLNREVVEALDALASEPSNPQYLAQYQAKLAEYTTP